MRRAVRVLPDFFAIVGAIAIVRGVGMVMPALAWIVAGVGALLAAISLAVRERRTP
jgi:hypothetical protein